MIRFVRIGDQIAEGVNEFAFFETTGDGFLKFNKTQVWESWNCFQEDFMTHWICWDDEVAGILTQFKELYDDAQAEIAQGRASNSNSRDLVSKPVSAPPQGDGKYHEGYKEGHRKGYYKGYEIGKEHQRTAMQEGKVTYINITKDQQYCRSPTYKKRIT